MVDVHKLYSRFHKTRLLDDPLPISADELEELFQAYFEALKEAKILSALRVGGVDNWEWYGESLEDAGLSDPEED